MNEIVTKRVLREFLEFLYIVTMLKDGFDNVRWLKKNTANEMLR